MKGITPIISIIILLLITIGLASAAWTYMSGYMSNLLSKNLDVSTGSCIGGTQVVFIIRNTGTDNVNSANINCLNLISGSVEPPLVWEWLNGSAAGTPTLGAGVAARAKISTPCTTIGNPKMCKYQLTLAGSTWHQDIPVQCAG